MAVLVATGFIPQVRTKQQFPGVLGGVSGLMCDDIACDRIDIILK